MPKIPFASHSYERNAHNLPPVICRNWMAENTPIPGRSHVLIPTPGFKLFADFGDGNIIRGEFEGSGVLAGQAYVVAGEKAYKLESDGTFTEAGDIPGTGKVQFAASKTQIAVISDTEGYVIDVASVTVINDPDFPRVTSVTYANGYFLWTQEDTGQMIFSSVLDAFSYEVLDFVDAEYSPDTAKGLVTDHGQVLVVGVETIQPFVSSADPNAPFVPVPQGVIEKGSLSRDCLQKRDNTIFFVGDDRIVYRLNGYTPERISKHAIEEYLSDLTDVEADGLDAWTYVEDGHTYYVLDIPGHGTYSYDLATGEWHERSSWDQELFEVYLNERMFGKNLVGSRSDGKIYHLSRKYTTYSSEIIERAVTAGVPIEEGRPVAKNLILDITAGHAAIEGQGSDPEIMLRYSDDTGKSWSKEKRRKLGRKGLYKWRNKFNRLGRMRPPGRIYELRTTDPFPYSIIGPRMNARKI